MAPSVVELPQIKENPFGILYKKCYAEFKEQMILHLYFQMIQTKDQWKNFYPFTCFSQSVTKTFLMIEEKLLYIMKDSHFPKENLINTNGREQEGGKKKCRYV